MNSSYSPSSGSVALAELLPDEAPSATLDDVLAAVEAAAAGDLNVRVVNIEGEDATARMAWAVNRLLDITEAYCRESYAAIDHANRRQYFRKIVATGLRGDFVWFAGTVNEALDLMARRDADFMEFAEQNVRPMVAAVSGEADQLSENARELRESSEAAAAQANLMSSNAVEATESINAVAAAVEDFTASINEISEQITRTANVAANTVRLADETESAVNALGEAAATIGSVVDLIKKIASQTRLLALNATIEAARAGEYGKGFAVVAQEVKNLADQTAGATEGITRQIDAVRTTTKQVVDAMGSVSGRISEIETATSVVAASIEEQSAVIKEVAGSVNTVAGRAAEIRDAAASVEEVTKVANDNALQVAIAATNLTGNADGLNDQVDAFIGRLGQ